MDFFFTMDRKRKLGCVLFNNLLTSSRKRRRKEKGEFDAMYQSFEEPAEVIDEGSFEVFLNIFENFAILLLLQRHRLKSDGK